jgi:uncharacterized damage-inducible protein DinB
VLKAYPENKLDLKPNEKLRTAKELIWTIVKSDSIMSDLIGGKLNFEKMQTPPPATLREILSTYEKNHGDTATKLRSTPEDDFNKTVQFMVAPKQMSDQRRGDVLWFVLMDGIHHRGQLSVYARIAGAKVPSIYGPTADEPWR